MHDVLTAFVWMKPILKSFFHLARRAGMEEYQCSKKQRPKSPKSEVKDKVNLSGACGHRASSLWAGRLPQKRSTQELAQQLVRDAHLPFV